jgi:hypothetical protein
VLPGGYDQFQVALQQVFIRCLLGDLSRKKRVRDHWRQISFQARLVFVLEKKKMSRQSSLLTIFVALVCFTGRVGAGGKASSKGDCDSSSPTTFPLQDSASQLDEVERFWKANAAQPPRCCCGGPANGH